MSGLIEGRAPRYQFVHDDVLSKITNGVYAEGDRLPSESALQAVYSVSRITIRRAMELLQNEGYILKASGVGTVVRSSRKTLVLDRLSSFKQENAGRDCTSDLVSFELAEGPARVCSELRLPAGALFYISERIRSVNGERIGFQRVYVPADLIEMHAEDLSSTQASLYELFEERGISLSGATETIEAKPADGRPMQHLKVPKGTPLLYFERATFDTINRGIEFAMVYYRADRYRYRVHLDCG